MSWSFVAGTTTGWTFRITLDADDVKDDEDDEVDDEEDDEEEEEEESLSSLPSSPSSLLLGHSFLLGLICFLLPSIIFSFTSFLGLVMWCWGL